MGVSIQKMIEELIYIPEEAWGGYAFCHELLERRFSREQKEEYTRLAINCGREEAGRLKKAYGVLLPQEYMGKLDLKVTTPDTPTGGGHVIFAQYVEPDEITVFMDCVKRAERLVEEEALESYLQEVSIYELLLAHELFHAIEYKKEKTIYTQTEKVELWRKPFSNKSRILCLSEIAAMAFAKELLQLTFSPYVMDVLLMYSYQKEAAAALYEEIMETTAGKEHRECLQQK